MSDYDYDALEKRMDGRACELSDGGLIDWSNTMDDGRKAIQCLRTRVAALESDNDNLRHDLERQQALMAQLGDCDLLIDIWRSNALQDVPAEYADRGMARKYLNGDNAAGGMCDCADELADVLRPLEQITAEAQRMGLYDETGNGK